MKSLLSTALVIAAASSACHAAAIFVVTEAYTGVSGEDGTPDWFELTNLGDMSASTAGLLYDDSTPTVASSGALDAFTLAPGESAVFIIGGNATDITDFETIWGSIPRLGIADGGGNLGDGVDSVNIGTDNAGTFQLIDSLAFDSVIAGELETITDPTGTGTPELSAAGVDGAYASNAFFNDNIGGATNMIQLVGSPGINVPEPSSSLFALLALTCLGRRKRA